MEQSYKEKYEDILARLERAKNDDEVCDERFCCVIDDLIPELAESENEKIRREIINYFQCQSEEEPTRKEIHDKWIAWLENIPYTIDHEKRDGFHLGYKACLERQGEQKPEENKVNIGRISPNSEWSEEDVFRTETLISVIKSGGSIRPELRNEFVNWLQSLQDRVQPQPKQGLREEEEAVLDALIRRLEGEDVYVSPHLAVECLKSLKDRVGCEANCTTTKEWSEEDKKIINGLIDSLTRISLNTRTDSTSPNYTFYKEIDWLKSLRPQNHWKPSELQLGCLSDAIEYYNSSGYPAPKLKELLDDLKKLKEGKV